MLIKLKTDMEIIDIMEMFFPVLYRKLL